MMQELKLYDPSRQKEVVQPGQFVVFHSHVHTHMAKKSAGSAVAPAEESICLVFDSLEEAETYCQSKVEQIPSLCCEIYDHTGKSKPPTLTYIVNKTYLKTPGKHAHWGWSLVAAGVFCFWIEWHWYGTLLVPVIIGINLVIAGLRMVYWGRVGAYGERRSNK